MPINNPLAERRLRAIRSQGPRKRVSQPARRPSPPQIEVAPEPSIREQQLVVHDKEILLAERAIVDNDAFDRRLRRSTLGGLLLATCFSLWLAAFRRPRRIVLECALGRGSRVESRCSLAPSSLRAFQSVCGHSLIRVSSSLRWSFIDPSAETGVLDLPAALPAATCPRRDGDALLDEIVLLAAPGIFLANTTRGPASFTVSLDDGGYIDLDFGYLHGIDFDAVPAAPTSCACELKFAM